MGRKNRGEFADDALDVRARHRREERQRQDIPAHALGDGKIGVYRRLGWKDGDLPVAERVCRNILTLPLFPAMTRDDVVRVVENLVAILHAHRKP